MADGVDPAVPFQGLDDVGGHGDVADIFDVAARHRLAIGDDCQGFHHRARVARWFFVLQSVQVGLIFGLGLEVLVGGKLDEFDVPVRPVAAQVVEQRALGVVVELLVEQLLEFEQRHWFDGC